MTLKPYSLCRVAAALVFINMDPELIGKWSYPLRISGAKIKTVKMGESDSSIDKGKVAPSLVGKILSTKKKKNNRDAFRSLILRI